MDRALDVLLHMIQLLFMKQRSLAIVYMNLEWKTYFIKWNEGTANVHLRVYFCVMWYEMEISLFKVISLVVI